MPEDIVLVSEVLRICRSMRDSCRGCVLASGGGTPSRVPAHVEIRIGPTGKAELYCVERPKECPR
jgi:hypothetical protein